jgi:hypothetical protein
VCNAVSALQHNAKTSFARAIHLNLQSQLLSRCCCSTAKLAQKSERVPFSSSDGVVFGSRVELHVCFIHVAGLAQSRLLRAVVQFKPLISFEELIKKPYEET